MYNPTDRMPANTVDRMPKDTVDRMPTYDVYTLETASMRIEYATLRGVGTNYERLTSKVATYPHFSEWSTRPEPIPTAATFSRSTCSLAL